MGNSFIISFFLLNVTGLRDRLQGAGALRSMPRPGWACFLHPSTSPRLSVLVLEVEAKVKNLVVLCNLPSPFSCTVPPDIMQSSREPREEGLVVSTDLCVPRNGDTSRAPDRARTGTRTFRLRSLCFPSVTCPCCGESSAEFSVGDRRGPWISEGRAHAKSQRLKYDRCFFPSHGRDA